LEISSVIHVKQEGQLKYEQCPGKFVVLITA